MPIPSKSCKRCSLMRSENMLTHHAWKSSYRHRHAIWHHLTEVHWKHAIHPIYPIHAIHWVKTDGTRHTRYHTLSHSCIRPLVNLRFFTAFALLLEVAILWIILPCRLSRHLLVIVHCLSRPSIM